MTLANLFKSQIKEDHRVNKTFSYTAPTKKDEAVNLSFTLRIDNTLELKRFLDLLIQASDDIKEEIEKLET